MTSPAEQTFQIKRRLGPLWNAFFQGFGKLTPVQLDAVPLLLARENLVVCSPTASGKTEAALAPIARHMLDEGVERPGLRLLYVIPTRALVADMHRRFSALFPDIGLTAAFRTSDTPHIPQKFPQVLFTTPESFDSLLCRKRGVWKNIEAIVLDEVHLLDNTYRGDQLRVLLARLERDSHDQTAPLKVILSATIPDPEAVAERYIGAAKVVSTGEPRTIDFSVVPTLAEAVARCKHVRRHKILVFCNSRMDCEILADQARNQRLWPADSIFVHHASLAHTHRARVEAALREARLSLCFATMTLELGMDIGDVSAAVLYRPPPSPTSFQQRLGRACRRENTIFSLGISTSDAEAQIFRFQAELAEKMFLEPADYSPDLSVVVQQVFSILFAYPSGLSPDELYGFVDCLCPKDTFQAIIDQLVLDDFVRRSHNHLSAGQKVMDMGERGEVHSNISDSRGTQVVDASTGQVVGQVALHTSDQKTVTLGGRTWAIAGRSRGSVVVSPTRTKDKAGSFVRRSEFGKFFPYLPKWLQSRIAADASSPS